MLLDQVLELLDVVGRDGKNETRMTKGRKEGFV